MRCSEYSEPKYEKPGRMANHTGRHSTVDGDISTDYDSMFKSTKRVSDKVEEKVVEN